MENLEKRWEKMENSVEKWKKIGFITPNDVNKERLASAYDKAKALLLKINMSREMDEVDITMDTLFFPLIRSLHYKENLDVANEYDKFKLWLIDHKIKNVKNEFLDFEAKALYDYLKENKVKLLPLI